MMQKSKSRKSRRMLALALVPAAIAAVAVLNLPMVANALNAVANTKMPFAESDGKVTNSMDVSNEFEAEIHVEEVAQVEISMENPEATHTASSLKGRVSNIKINKSASSSDQQPKFIFKVNGKELQPDAEGNIDYHGMKFNVNILNSLSPEQIKSMTVNREASTVTIELMDPEEVPAKVMAKLPIYPGGDKALLNYVCENVKYPDGAPTDGKTYRVVTQFEISKTGKVGSAKILRSQGELFDAEALRVISLLPDFEPGENENGEKIATTYTLPISFKAVGDDEKAE